MKTKVLAIGLIIVIGCIVVGVMLNRPPAREVVSVKPQTAVQAPVQQVAALPSSEEVAPPPSQPTPPVKPVQPPRETKTKPQPANQPQQQLGDPDARVALAFVGEDPDAEAYWEDAIFDTSLPDKERDDLMEDLNEVGFADPHHPGPQDVPLILNRLAIIQQLVPYADDFMLPHLGEAWKDLNNMANQAFSGQ